MVPSQMAQPSGTGQLSSGRHQSMTVPSGTAPPPRTEALQMAQGTTRSMVLAPSFR